MEGDLAAGLALLRQGAPAAAIAPLRRAAADPLARLNLGLALMDAGHLAEAESELRALHAMGAEEAELELRLGTLAAGRGDAPGARRHLRAALALDPGLAAAHVALARLAPDVAEADAALAAGLAALPGHPDLQAERAALHGDAAALRALAAARPGSGWIGRLLARAGVGEGPGCAGAVAAALGAEAAGEGEAALAQWRLATALNPEDATAAAGLAEALLARAEWPAAADAFARAVALEPGKLSLRIGEADALFRAHRLADAAEAYRGALAAFGPLPVLLMNLATVLASQGRHEESLALSRQAPPDAVRDLHLLSAVGPYAEGEADAAALRRHADALHARWQPEAPPPRRARPGERLRVGLLSPGLGRHPVGWLTLAGIEQLPAHGFDVVVASLRPHDDPLARRFRAVAAEWHELPPGLDDATLAARLRAMDLDLLLELGGHGEGGRCAALRFRPAPVQVKWVGAQSATTGVPGLDWMLSDGRETPPGFEPFYTERLLRLPDGYVCYTPPAYAPPVAPLPALARGQVTFGCFNNLQKVERGARRAWGEVLRQLPEARLVLRTHALGDAATREEFRALCAADGIPAGRLVLEGPSSHEKLLAAYGEVDVSLDAFPYSGGLTVCESLWMGVPVVAMAGTHFAGRHALSHLTSLGMADWCAADAQAYVRRALAAARDLPALATLRAGLRDRMRASPLMDAPRFGANLAAALRRAVEEA
ncbi:hypothetical protein ACI6QG_01870 [Roseococcus sp. DSY-14]|uniref:tetratricopeptide repeat protein n=1 Tax=Roseococcus sp. DSY-14 TaxID=3369650 RepID=UPI00387AE500